MKALYLKTICSFVQGFPAPGLALKVGQSQVVTLLLDLDAIGNRCNHLSHANEPHHVERGDQQSQGFRSCESNRDAASLRCLLWRSHLGRTFR